MYASGRPDAVHFGGSGGRRPPVEIKFEFVLGCPRTACMRANCLSCFQAPGVPLIYSARQFIRCCCSFVDELPRMTKQTTQHLHMLKYWDVFPSTVSYISPYTYIYIYMYDSYKSSNKHQLQCGCSFDLALAGSSLGKYWKLLL